MKFQLREGKIWIGIDPDDAEHLRDLLSDFIVGFIGSDKFPLLDKFQTLLENAVESTLGLPLFPKD